MIQPVFASGYLDSLQAKAMEKHLAARPYWHRLLHYRRNLLGIYQSEIDDPTFFVSARGRRDPEAELDATLAAFFTPAPRDPEEQQAQCRYPARLVWLTQELQINPAQLPTVSCTRYENWKGQLEPTSVSLVFASSFMNNPSSMYGHTFLLLKKQRHSGDELLDYAVNFAADLERDNGFLYALKGLAGGYHGRFSTFPYYMKVQEYSNLESRDLWEYDLNLSSGSLKRLMDHLWELGNVRIRYYFLNKNCSYYLMSVLEVAEPERDFKKRFLLKTIPVDTIRAVIGQPGLSGDVSRRPSHASKLIAEHIRLRASETGLAEQLAARPAVGKTTTLSVLEPARRALVLDAAYDLFRYRVGFLRDQPPAIQEKEHELLLLRNATGVSSTPVEVPAVPGPQAGHNTGRINLSYGFSNHSHFEELSLRPAIHDQDDPPEGYLPGSKLEMFHTRLRYDNDRSTLYLQEFSLVDMVSLTPWDRWIHPPSWKVKTGVAVANDLQGDPENSLYYGLNLGNGYAAYVPGTDKVLLFGMVQMDLQLGHAFTHTVRFGGGPVGGVLFNPVKYWRARFQASQTPYASGGTPATTQLGFYQSLSLSRNIELRAKLERQTNYKEVLFTLAWFL